MAALLSHLGGLQTAVDYGKAYDPMLKTSEREVQVLEEQLKSAGSRVFSSSSFSTIGSPGSPGTPRGTAKRPSTLSLPTELGTTGTGYDDGLAFGNTTASPGVGWGGKSQVRHVDSLVLALPVLFLCPRLFVSFFLVDRAVAHAAPRNQEGPPATSSR